MITKFQLTLSQYEELRPNILNYLKEKNFKYIEHEMTIITEIPEDYYSNFIIDCIEVLNPPKIRKRKKGEWVMMFPIYDKTWEDIEKEYV